MIWIVPGYSSQRQAASLTSRRLPGQLRDNQITGKSYLSAFATRRGIAYTTRC
jgi:hypothetical protein